MGRCKLCCFALGLLLTIAAQAHVVSMSTGELQMDGPTAVFELRIPLYEVAQLDHPEAVLLAQFRFGDGHLTRSSCRQDQGFYICHAEYEFPGLHPDSLEVACTLYQVTVPNHVHLLTATQGPNTDQEFSTSAFPRAWCVFIRRHAPRESPATRPPEPRAQPKAPPVSSSSSAWPWRPEALERRSPSASCS